jgi:lysophospholipase L1-like esterase
MDRVKALLISEKPVKWIFCGDSITHGALHTFGCRDYVEIFAERVRFELDRTTDVIINTAINGDTSRGLLKGFNWRIVQFKPDVVFVMIGMNDCDQQNGITLEEFGSNLNSLVQQIGDIGALTVLQTTCPILPDLFPERETHFASYMDVVRHAASDHELPLIDHAHYWKERPDSHFFWMSNSLHPNAYGHRAFAMCLFQSLDIYDRKSQTCRLHLP